MFEGQRLSKENLSMYCGGANYYQRIIGNIKPLLQNDYGEANDCTIASITTIISSWLPFLDINNIYLQVEAIARRYGYNGSNGTNPVVIRKVYQESLLVFGIPYHVTSKYMKGIGFTWNFIKDKIDHSNNPILLNLWKDGRNYYYSHSVVIVGYANTYNKKFLVVYDNWIKNYSYIDYDKLSLISSIQVIN